MIVSPSLLSADFCHLSEDIDMINNSEAELLHLDIMDGVFVPNISFGFPVIKDLHKICKKPLDIHLMIVEPQKFIKEVKEIGAEYMNVHYEACLHLSRVVQQIKEAGMKAGVTINPATPVSVLAVSSPMGRSLEKYPCNSPAVPRCPGTIPLMETGRISPLPKGISSLVSTSQIPWPRPPNTPVSGS